MAFRSYSLWICALILVFRIAYNSAYIVRYRNPCYDERKNPMKCFPPFVNAAFKLPVAVTNTCGEDEDEYYCHQTGVSGSENEKSCDICDSSDPAKAHNASYLTDYHILENQTWWQSSTMLEEVQYPNSINLTLSLGKAFEITYIRLKFYSSRPESFAVYKRTYGDDKEWIPFQYYSSTCESTYGILLSTVVTKDDEAKATCRDDFSDISPLTGGSVAFSTLEGRPSAYTFENSPVLQEWVTATDIMISLNRINTFRDEVFGDPASLRSYFYAISDFAVGGRCKCNGHASECVKDGDRLKCLCQHNTDGPDCETCLPFFNDRPWHRATSGNAHECKPCDCNGLSETCEFDIELYQRMGHGGRCTNCRENTGGPNCNLCKEGYYHSPEDRRCIPCHCHHLGSQTQQCDDYGRCICHPGVMGDKCDQCQPYYYNLSSEGCIRCRCHEAGLVLGTSQTCDSVTGQCSCKPFVADLNCDRCLEGYYGLSHDNPLGCSPCFCYGHSTECSLDDNYVVKRIGSLFRTGSEGWVGMSQRDVQADVEHLDVTQEISLVSNDDQAYYFIAPGAFLGDIHNSYNLRLSFNLRVDGGEEQVRPSIDDLIIISGDNRRISTPVFGQRNPVPNREKQHFEFVMSENEYYQWYPSNFDQIEFRKFLSNITSIRIRATYSSQGIGYLSNVSLETTIPSYISGNGDHPPAVVEQCRCPEGYLGQFCESCAPGYMRSPPYSGPFGSCVPCRCNGHSEICEPESGRCICEHNTDGLNCESCVDGYYGNALNGTKDDCRPCNCPNWGRCTQILSTGDVVCLDCEKGYGGLRCDECIEGYHRVRGIGDSFKCVACDCNNNTDPNAVGNCDRETGSCLKCLYNTVGVYCHLCRKGYFGVAVQEPHGECHSCECSEYGSMPLTEEEMEDGWGGEGPATQPHGRIFGCDIWTGQCRCLDNVIGKRCEACLDGTWDLYSGTGCKDCLCDEIGSVNESCDTMTGQCHCKPGVGGLKCDQCLPYHYGFSDEGCHVCQCNHYGSLGSECDLMTGACQCRPQYFGRACDQCDINYYDLASGCIPCPICYETIVEPANEVRRKIEQMKLVVTQARELPTNHAEDDEEFKQQLAEQSRAVDALWDALEGEEHWEDLKWARNASDIVHLIQGSYDDSFGKGILTKYKQVSIDTELKTANELLESTQEELENSRKRLEEDGQELLETLEREHQKSGQQSEKMTQIAREARDGIVRLEQLVDETVNISKKAQDASDDAYNLSSMLREKSLELETKIEAIKSLDDLMRQSYLLTVNISAQSQAEATSAFNQLEQILAEVKAIVIDEISPEETNTSQLLLDMKALNGDLNHHFDAIEKSKQESSSAKSNFDRALQLGQAAKMDRENLKRWADDAFNESIAAQMKAENVLEDAQKTLATLKSFDDNIQTTKKAKEDALELIHDINKNITVARNYTALASYQMNEGGMVSLNAKNSETSSYLSLLYIYNETQDLESLINKSREMDENTSDLKSKSSRIDGELGGLESRVNDLEQEHREEEESIDALRRTTNETIYSLAGHKMNVTTYLNKIDSMLLLLNSLDDINEEEVSRLETELDEAESSYASVDAENTRKTVAEQHEKLTFWLAQLMSEIKHLESDVANVQTISETIPKNVCFKLSVLEPTSGF